MAVPGSKTRRKLAGTFLANTVLVGLSVPFSFPLVWSLVTSLQTLEGVYRSSFLSFPQEPQWRNYVDVFRILPLTEFLLNSCWITFGAIAGELLTAPLVAFAFARLRFPFRETLFVVMLSTLMLPPIILLIPTYILFSKLGLVDTYVPLVLPGWLGGSVFSIFILRQFFKTIPLELEDAARIDGCSSFRIYFHIFLPLAMPALATIGVLSFVSRWNDFATPLVYLQSIDKFPISLGIMVMKDAYSALAPHYLMAASIISLVPLILLFLSIQRVFVEGIILSGLKS